MVGTTEAGPPVVLDQVRSAGVRVELVQADHTWDEVRRKVATVGRVVGREREAQALQADLDAQWAAVQKQVAAATRRPRAIFILSHGGAAVPAALGRLSRNHQISQGKYADPRKGFEAMYFDSCVFDTDTLEYLARKAGPERVMIGSDMPFPIGDPAPTRILEGAYFTEAQKKGILGGNAQTVFRVRQDCWCPR